MEDEVFMFSWQLVKLIDTNIQRKGPEVNLKITQLILI